jgi:hypothetical protein
MNGGPWHTTPEGRAAAAAESAAAVAKLPDYAATKPAPAPAQTPPASECKVCPMCGSVWERTR